MDAMERIGLVKPSRMAPMVISGGLAATAQSNRVRLSGGKISVIDGPFTGKTKRGLSAASAIMEFKSKEEALESAKHFMDLHRQHWPGWEGETEVRQMFGPEDFPPQK